MFIDEKTNTEILADLDETVIRATLRAQDLVPTFLDVIKNTPEYVQIMMSTNHDIGVVFDADADDEDERWESEYMAYFLNEELINTLNAYAPEGYYFGSHEGNGSDFGYWKITTQKLENMKHFTMIELGSDAESPMIGTIDNITNNVIGRVSFEERFMKAVGEHFDIEDFNYDEIPDLFASSPYEDITIEIDGINYNIRIMETWIY